MAAVGEVHSEHFSFHLTAVSVKKILSWVLLLEEVKLDWRLTKENLTVFDFT